MSDYDSERLEVIEAMLESLVSNLLTYEQKFQVKEKIKQIRDRNWEQRMGDDL